MSIDNTESTIDSREILSRIEALEGDRDTFEAEGDADPAAAWAASHAEEAAELKTLTALIEDAEQYSGDRAVDGFTLIRDSYFTDYAIELCQAIGDLPKNIPSYIEIDREKTASNIQQDYTSVEFDGVTYWVR